MGKTMQKLLLLIPLLFLGTLLKAQNRVIKGKVISADGPLAGASIVIKGKTTGTASGPDGAFTLNAPEGKVTLVVSSIGYAKSERSVGENETNVEINLLKDNTGLSEIVVTALGITRQSRTLVYATQSVKPAELTGVRDANNVLNSLTGKIANAVITQGSGGPGSGARIVLRGNRSIQGSNNALIVVDGVPIDNSTYSAAGSDFGSIQGTDGASNINPDDIASVTVLRGASAAALYGSQAGNGVIVITTKKGSKDKMSVSINSGAVLESTFALPKVQNIYGQGSGGNIDSSAGASWGPKMTGQDFTNFLGNPARYSPQPDNIKDFFRTGLSLNNSISVSGGSDKAQTYLSYTNKDIQGIVPRNNLISHTVDLRLTNQISKKFSTDAKVTYINEEIKNKPRTGEENSPTIDIYSIPRNLSDADARQYQFINNVGVPTPYANYPSTNTGIYQDPYWMIYNTALNQTRNRIMGFVSAKYMLTNWLSFTGRANIDKTFDKLTSQYSQGTTLWAHTGGYYQQQNIETTQKWFDGIFEGNNNITNDLKINYLAGAIFQDSKSDQLTNTADGLTVTNKFSLNYAANPSIYSYGDEVQTQAVFGQANISYKDAIFLDASLRNDWDSRLGSPYSYQYYSVGGSAVLSDLIASMPKSISFLKASLSYAEVGNGGQFGLLTSSYGYSQGAGNGFLSRSTTLPFPGLKPEIVKSLEASIEARFLNDRLGFTATYYKSNSFNQLLNIPLPTATGYSTKYINAGNIQNQGFELVLNATPVRKQDFNWDIALNFALNRNKVIRLSPDLKVVYLSGSFGRSATPQVKEGGSYGDMVGFQWVKNAKGQHEVDSLGRPVTSNGIGLGQGLIGNFNPKENLGLTNTFRYKAFSLRILTDGRIGGVMVDGTEMNLAFSGIPEVTAKYREGGLDLKGVDANGAPVGATINAQQFWQTVSTQRYGTAEFFTYDATNFRVRELSLGYEIPLHTKLFIKAARISAVARNVLWIYRGKSILDIPGIGTRKMTFDPDMSLGNGNFQGISYGTLPATRSYGINLQLTF
ncbi:MAG TPA: SusC/RagA family TonB-linked outer membrane protein [Hanamia sp.]|nr:SusC/RagA family TonB-linked outer membrane protein [Hanamia sp.]